MLWTGTVTKQFRLNILYFNLLLCIKTTVKSTDSPQAYIKIMLYYIFVFFAVESDEET